MQSVSCLICLVAVALRGNDAEAQTDDARRTPIVEAVEKCRPAVVTLKVAKSYGDGEAPERTGTGVIVDRRGYIVTSRHLIVGAVGIRVILADRTALAARVIAGEPDTDLAILQIDPPRPLPTLTPASGRDLLVGERVIAIGHPYGYDYTVSTGIISGLGRSITMPAGAVLSNVIQFDAPINPGNSGGPLLNIHGAWIGLSAAVREGAQGIAFALNIETVKAMLRRHLEPDVADNPDNACPVILPTSASRSRTER